MLDRKSVIKPTKPLPQSWYGGLAVGRVNFWVNAAMSIQKSWIQVSFSCGGDYGLAHFCLLQREKDAIEREIGCHLEWEELPGKKEKRISLRKTGVDPRDREAWRTQHAWLAEYLDKFHKAFAPRVKGLNADDYQPSGEG